MINERSTTFRANNHRPNILCCVVCCAFTMAVSVHQTSKTTLKFNYFKTDENEIKTYKIASMLFYFMLLCLFWRFKARKSDVFKNKLSEMFKSREREQGMQLGDPQITPLSQTVRRKNRIYSLRSHKKSWPSKE